MVSRGVLTAGQRDAIVAAQHDRPRPFGALAEEMFAVHPARVEEAWAEQFVRLAERVDVRAIEPASAVLSLIDRRQAWQFAVLPLGIEGRLLRIATCESQILRAVRFVNWRLEHECDFVLTDEAHLEEAIGHYFPIGGARLRRA